MIKAENIVKKFDNFTALNGITCTIPSGCIYGMVGSNGAGKSTFLRLMSGVYRPDEGRITIDGEPVYENPAAKGKIAFVPDELYFLPGATMDRMASLYQSIYPKFDYNRYAYLAEAFGLNPKSSLTRSRKECVVRRRLFWRFPASRSICLWMRPLMVWIRSCEIW